MIGKYANEKDYIAARDAALMSGDPEEVRRHLIRAGTPGAAGAKRLVIEIAMHKARVHWRGCPPELLYESVWWLHDRKYHLDY